MNNHNYMTAEGGGRFSYLAPEVVLLEIGTEAGFAISRASNENFEEDSEQSPW